MAQTTKKNKARILLIEDNKLILRAYHDGLERAGYAVYHISNGVGAVEYIKKIKPDLIILDMIMPACDGYDVLRDIQKEKHALENIPIMVASNLFEKSYQEEITKYPNVKKCLTKSDFTVDELIEEIKKLV